MAASEKVYYLENGKKRFWEVTVRGSDSILRYGKVGCKGRTCAPKNHDSPARCRQWAVIQADMKRFDGYDDPVEENPDVPVLKRRVSSIQAERVGLSRQKTIKLGNNDIKEETSQSQEEEPMETKAKKKDWRKPHRKQTTIRAIGEVINYQQRLKDQVKEDTFRPPLTRRVTSLRSNGLGLSKQSTIRLQTTDTPDKSGRPTRQPTLTRKQSTVNKKDWRKPHKKQTTIRALRMVMSYQERHADQPGDPTERPALKRKTTSLPQGPTREKTMRLEDNNDQLKQTKCQQTLANKQQTIIQNKPRKPHKKQTTIRKLGQQSNKTWRKPPKKQGTIRALGKQISYQQKR